MKKLTLLAGLLIVSVPAFAAGIDSRVDTCGDLHRLIAARGFVFISQPTFGDFVVSNVSHCSGAEIGGSVVALRSVPTRDNPECVVQYCVDRESQTDRK